jgi:hypothetical protein
MTQNLTLLFNQALQHLGGGPPLMTDAATDTSKPGKLFRNSVDVCRRAVLRLFPWNFAIDRASLTLKTITGCADNGSGLIRVTAVAHGFITGDYVTIVGVSGTQEAVGSWTITKITNDTFDLQASTFTNTYVSGGQVGLAPAYGYQFKLPLPTNCVRIISAEDDPIFEIEGQYIVTDEQGLKIKYLKDQFDGATDYSLADPLFFEALSLNLAWSACYAITESNKLKMEIWEQFERVLGRAKFVDSTEASRKEFSADERELARYSSGGGSWSRANR